MTTQDPHNDIEILPEDIVETTDTTPEALADQAEETSIAEDITPDTSDAEAARLTEATEEETENLIDEQDNENEEEVTAAPQADKPTQGKKALEKLLHSLEIDGQWFKRNLGLFFVITVGLLLFVTNGYQAQLEMIEEEALREQLKDIRFKALTKAADLTLKTRQSNIEQKLIEQGDSTLKAPKEAPFIIKQQ